jgi:hypothetical protein
LPAGKTLQRYRRRDEGQLAALSGRKRDCARPAGWSRAAAPNTPARKAPRSIHEGARDLGRDIAKTEAYQVSRHQRKRVEMLFAHLKRILKLDRLRLRGPTAPAMNSTSPPLPRTCENSRS